MFCTNCGKEIKDGSTFCSNCGAKIAAEPSEPKEEKLPEEPKIPEGSVRPEPEITRTGTEDRDSMLRQIIGKNVNYYLAQFSKIQETGKSKINWAAFFLSILHAGYRNVWKDWFKAVRLPLLIQLGAGLLTGIAFFIKPVLGFILMVVMVVASIWLFVAHVLYAKHFNQIYLEHVEQKLLQKDLKADPSIGRGIIAYLVMSVIYTVISSVMSLGMAGGLIGSMNSQMDDIDDYYMQDDFELEESEPVEDEMLSEIQEESEDTESAPETYEQWEGTWQREMGPSAYITVWSADEDGVMFAIGIGCSGYASYVDMRDCVAEWTATGYNAYYEDDSLGCGLDIAYEDGTLTINENGTNSYGLGLSGIYVPAEEADYPNCEYVFPDSSDYEIYEEDCDGLTALECKIAKNEIYARHGRLFKDESLQDYFDSCSWYTGSIAPEDFTEDMLNETEIANIRTIQAYESYMGY